MIFGRYSLSKGNAVSPRAASHRLPIDTTAHSITIQESHTFSPNTINQFRIAWTYFKSLGGYPLADRNLAVEEFGLLNLTPSTTAYGLPQVMIAGLSTIGANPFQPGGQQENLYSFANDLSWIAGSTVSSSAMTAVITVPRHWCSRLPTAS